MSVVNKYTTVRGLVGNVESKDSKKVIAVFKNVCIS